MSNDIDFARIHDLLVQRYDLEELRTLSAQLSIRYDDLGGEGLQAKTRELILWLQRRERLDDLNFLLRDHRHAQSGHVSNEPQVKPVSDTALAAPRPDSVDLVIIAAMPEELEPVLDLIGGREQWQPFLLDKFLHYSSCFELDTVSLSIVACSLWKYGGNPTTAEIVRLQALNPGMIVMTGICAGWESKEIQFGDVIVADRAFQAGEGKRSARRFEADIRTYQPPPWLLQWLNDFSTNKEWFRNISAPRPQSLRYQAEWLLCKMSEQSTTYPATASDWKSVRANSIDFKRVWQLLLGNSLITHEGLLTERASAMLDQLRQKNYGQLSPLKDRKQPLAHYGAFASTEAIIAVPNPFQEHAKRVRKVRAIELEVAALFSAAAEIGVPAFAVKGVSDYGTPEKEDSFHNYAAEASARWVYEFIRTYGRYLSSISDRAR